MWHLQAVRSALPPEALLQVYRSDLDWALAAQPSEVLREAADRAWERWSVPLTVEAQTVDLKPGSSAGVPAWTRIPSSSCGEAALVVLGPEPLLSYLPGDRPDASESTNACAVRLADGALRGEVLVPPNRMVFAPSGGTLRFRPATQPGRCVIAWIRPRDGGPVANRLRTCARVFSPAPSSYRGPLPPWAASRDFVFDSKVTVLGGLGVCDARSIAHEPTFAGASPAWVAEHGGPLARAYLDLLPAGWKTADDIIIAGKRDELSPGWYPCLAGWHMDGTSRADKRSDGTPDLRNPGRKVDQMAACFGAASPTAFLTGRLTLPEIPVGEQDRSPWARLIEDQIAAGSVRPGTAPPFTLFSFGWGDFHTCSKSDRPGWRYFIKAMRHRGDKPENRSMRTSTVSWPLDAGAWPEDPLGIFPQDLPVG